MELNIFLDGEPVELKSLVPPKQINENLTQLQELFPLLVDNGKNIEFLGQYMNNG
jgi:hypothetical protein